ncbi:MAG: FAD-dependent monooxygenase [Ketobacteraceae bacterium]|nr:FAD-dependent monooxygenase [Ketobacteraceae bacterium]
MENTNPIQPPSSGADIVIVGGGMAGLALAALLRDAPVSVILVDRAAPADPESWPAQYDPRVSALSLASEALLRRTGAWGLMSAERLCAYRHMHVWDGEGTGTVDFDVGDLAGEAIDHLGTIAENRVTQWALYRQVQQQQNVTFVESGLKAVSALPDGWQVSLENGDTWQPSLLVGADGGRSMVRDLAGFNVRAWPYHHSAIVTTVRTEQPHQHTAWQVFLPTGPLAFLPLSDCAAPHGGGNRHYCSIVWSADTAKAEDIMAWDDATFMSRLGSAFEYHLGNILEADPRFSFPLVQQHATHYTRPGLALIGDAAHTIHPLAGQGINLGFLDAAVLAEEIQQNLSRGLPAGERSGLRRYERRRKSHNLMTMSAMEGFKRFFEPLHWLLATARNEGMSQFNRHYLAKRQVISHAMGIAGDIPETAKKVQEK